MIEIAQPIADNKKMQTETNSAIVINSQTVENYYQMLHRRYSIALLVLTSVSAFAYLYLIAQHQTLYLVQCSQCRATSFASLYAYLLITIALTYIHLKNFKTNVFADKPYLFIIGSEKIILGVLGSQIVLAGCFLAQEWLYCSENIWRLYVWMFIYQLIQYTSHFGLMIVYYYRVYKEIIIIHQNKAENAKKRSIELFNASFALTDTRSEANYRVPINHNEFMAKIDMNQSTTNSSQFTTSYCDNTKMVSMFSADSIFNVSRMESLRKSPKIKRFMHNKEIQKGLIN